MSKTLNHSAFIMYLAALAAFAPFSTDIYLASLPTIKDFFVTSSANVQLTLSLFFVGFAIAQLFWGPLSDRVGRKPVIYLGLVIFIIGSMLCAWSHHIAALIIARAIQAVGACSGIVIAIAIIRDRFADRQLARMISNIMGVALVAPMIAPIIGSYLLVHFNWQANFYFLTLYGLMLLFGTCFLKESYPPEKRKPLPVNQLLGAYSQQLSHPPFLWATLAASTSFAAMFAFISSSAFVYITIYHLAQQLFGYVFAANGIALISGVFSSKFLKGRLHDKTIVTLALIIGLFGAILMLVMLNRYPQQIISVILPSVLVTYGVGLLYPEIMSYALKHVLHYAGLTSSLLGTCRFMFAAGVAFVMGLLIHKSALPLAWMMLLLNTIAVLTVIFYFKSRRHTVG